MKKTTQSLFILTIIVASALGFADKSYAGGDKFTEKYSIDPSTALPVPTPTCEEVRDSQVETIVDLACRLNCYESSFKYKPSLTYCLQLCDASQDLSGVNSTRESLTQKKY